MLQEALQLWIVDSARPDGERADKPAAGASAATSAELPGSEETPDEAPPMSAALCRWILELDRVLAKAQRVRSTMTNEKDRGLARIVQKAPSADHSKRNVAKKSTIRARRNSHAQAPADAKLDQGSREATCKGPASRCALSPICIFKGYRIINRNSISDLLCKICQVAKICQRQIAQLRRDKPSLILTRSEATRARFFAKTVWSD